MGHKTMPRKAGRYPFAHRSAQALQNNDPWKCRMCSTRCCEHWVVFPIGIVRSNKSTTEVVVVARIERNCRVGGCQHPGERAESRLKKVAAEEKKQCLH
jgi:hypothetical protein